MKDKKIAVFDSGVGGLTVLKEIKKLLASEDIIYFGDTKRVPYGTRSKEEIIDFSLEVVDFLTKKDIKMIVVACNTITSNAIDEIKAVVDIPVIGVIEPGIKVAIRETKNKNIGLIGTEGTINSKVYQASIKDRLQGSQVMGVSAGDLVLIVERGIEEVGLANTLIKVNKYISEFDKFNMDTLILGCTHFPVLEREIKLCTENIKIIDPAYETAREVKKQLEENKTLNKGTSKGNIEYYISQGEENFRKVGERIMGEKIDNIYLVKL